MVPQPACDYADPVQLHRICESRRLAKAGVLSPCGFSAVHSNYPDIPFCTNAPDGVAFRPEGLKRNIVQLFKVADVGRPPQSTKTEDFRREELHRGLYLLQCERHWAQ